MSTKDTPSSHISGWENIISSQTFHLIWSQLLLNHTQNIWVPQDKSFRHFTPYGFSSIISYHL
jgi:hypothetical protein